MNGSFAGSWFYTFTSFWSITMVVIFVLAIRLSYRIEARSPDLTNKSGIPRNAMIFHTVTNSRVARDPETQALRRKMILLLVANLAGFLVMWGAVSLIKPN